MSDEKNPNDKGPQGSEKKSSEPSGTKSTPAEVARKRGAREYFTNERKKPNTGKK